ncbi:MAG: prepilin peptidase [Lachnospiraceae bacterium]|nr:prepilin peptidase [Lachnospiraceae bacterium]
MREALLVCYLGAGAIMDGRRKMVRVSYLWIGTVLALGFLWKELSYGGLEVKELAVRLLPGIVFLLCSRFTREKVGYGDGMILLILGLCFPAAFLWQTWITAVFLITLWAGFLLCTKKGNRNTRIPFLPFLWLAAIMIWGFGYG